MEKDNRGVLKVKIAYKLRKLGVILRKWGKWLKNTPCRWGYHEMNLWRPGYGWYRDCKNCGKNDWKADPKLEDIDFKAYRIYLEERSKETGKYREDARNKLVELDKMEGFT